MRCGIGLLPPCQVLAVVAQIWPMTLIAASLTLEVALKGYKVITRLPSSRPRGPRAGGSAWLEHRFQLQGPDDEHRRQDRLGTLLL